MSAIAEEDRVRANVYALLSRLFSQGPDSQLLTSIHASARAVQGDGAFADAWHALGDICPHTDASAAGQDYLDLFVGTGMARVTPYLSHYMVRSGHEKVLVELRDELVRLGLARVASAAEPEDHIAALLDVMRHLALWEVTDSASHKQRSFYESYVEPGYARFCAAVEQSAQGRFYACAARLLRAFLDLERETFQTG